MKGLFTRIAALMAISGVTLLAQNVQGTWQGMLKAGSRDLRMVVKISLEDDKPKAVIYSIDQGGQPIPASTITRDGANLKMTIAAIGGTYEGKLSADGNSITGTWTQGPAPLPLNLARATQETAWAIPEAAPPPRRMAADAKPGFEVATIKPSNPDTPGKIFTVRGQDVVTVNTTLLDLVTMAYGLHAKEVIGGPAWSDSEKYDLTVKPDLPGQPNVDQIKLILGKLLADRFQLKFHRDKKELNVFALDVAKGGPKFSKSERDPNSLPGLFFRGQGNLNVTNATMGEFANLIQRMLLDKPVVNQTGLTEKYDFILKFTPDPGQVAALGGPPPGQRPADNPDAPPDLFTAMQQQLGLKLEATKAPADVLVIDHVEKPSDN
ncbi:MAG: TIGR03435 family protein [Acidobacteriia bacterium]|nr:TIGR03435 family protein [Terriglobia bacterium]